VLYGVGAYAWWGLAPVYFKSVKTVSPLEILAHRIVWSVVVLLILITVARRWNLLAAAVSRRSLRFLVLSTAFVSINWFLYIWAVTNDRVVESSLGYFINPLVNVVLGHLFFHERLAPREKVSVAIAVVAVTWLTIASGVVPWISLGLAISFGLYGLVRKLAAVTSIEALAIETTLLLPLAAAYLVYRARSGTMMFGESQTIDLLLLLAGPVTTVPLLLFAAAVRRLRLATVGLLQYISPSCQFLLGVLVYREPMTSARLVAFVLIWVAVGVYASGVRKLSR
jgi:chloramphenicol-sensitive protein RarD